MSDPSIPPPPTVITPDDYHAADAARRRLAQKSSLVRILAAASKTPKKAKNVAKHTVPLATATPPITAPLLDYSRQSFDPDMIQLDDSKLDASQEGEDQYEWAIVYENQRGMTAFSIPYYSRLSLLPNDPAPFTIASATFKASEQVPVTLQDYPLPDGRWRWVSKCWMIDMRSDSGEVSHDGFEYNWMFRSHNWRAEVGRFSAGGWVRRRRWVRLMMRPAQSLCHRHEAGVDDGGLEGSLLQSKDLDKVSISQPFCASADQVSEVQDIWRDDDTEKNWARCRMLMKVLGRDGPRLEVWQLWLERSGDESKGKGRQTDNDARSLVSELPVSRIPSKEQLLPILQLHGKDLLQRLFVYPDSRAKMVKMIHSAGLLEGSEVDPGMVDFWSYLTEWGLAETRDSC